LPVSFPLRGIEGWSEVVEERGQLSSDGGAIATPGEVFFEGRELGRRELSAAVAKEGVRGRMARDAG
jgi:hypothetical protein